MTPTNPARRKAALTLVLALAAGACSGDDGATLDLGEATTTVAAAEPTVPTTLAPTTTAAPTTSTTVAETTTTSEPEPDLSLEDQIRADFARTWEAFFECGADPENCDVSAIAVEDSPMETALLAEVETWISANLRADLSTGPRHWVFEDLVVVDDATAELTVCQTDGTWLMDIGDPEDPDDDVIFNDSLNSYRTRWVLQLTEDGWLRHSGERLAIFTGLDSCAA